MITIERGETSFQGDSSNNSFFVPIPAAFALPFSVSVEVECDDNIDGFGNNTSHVIERTNGGFTVNFASAPPQVAFALVWIAVK